MKYVVAFNGPPGSGKDTAAAMAYRWLTGEGYNCYDYKMSKPLKVAINGFCRVENPEQPHEELKKKLTPWSGPANAVTFRQAYIDFSESYAKPLWGHDVFTRWAIAEFEDFLRANQQIVPATVFIISDAGFKDEQDSLIDWVTPNNYAIARMVRPGHTFANDSRSYIYPPQRIYQENIYNDGDLRLCEDRVIRFLKSAIKAGQWTPVQP